MREGVLDLEIKLEKDRLKTEIAMTAGDSIPLKKEDVTMRDRIEKPPGIKEDRQSGGKNVKHLDVYKIFNYLSIFL